MISIKDSTYLRRKREEDMRRAVIVMFVIVVVGSILGLYLWYTNKETLMKSVLVTVIFPFVSSGVVYMHMSMAMIIFDITKKVNIKNSHRISIIILSWIYITFTWWFINQHNSLGFYIFFLFCVAVHVLVHIVFIPGLYKR